jgi:hypothetical protein
VFNPAIKSPLRRESFGLTDKIVGMYAGKFGGIYLDRDFFRWVKVAVEHWGDRFRLLLLTVHSRAEVVSFCSEFNIPEKAIIQYFVPHHEVPMYMSLADFALTPVKPVPSKRYCTPIKDGEYWAMGLPVIIPQGISDDSEIIERERIGYVLEDLSDVAFTNSIVRIETLLDDPHLSAKVVEVAVKYRSFEIARNVYRHVYPVEN